MPSTAPQVRTVSVDEVRIISVDFQGKLDSGELLTGTPTVTEVATDDFDGKITNIAVNTVALTINGTSVAIGQAVQFKIEASGATEDYPYTFDIEVDTDAGQTLEGRITLYVN